MKVFYRTDFPATRSAFAHDFISGVTVAIVALPLAIGFGITSGLTAAAGISTAIVAGFISALLGGSRFQVSGPTGAMTVVLIPVIHHYGIGAIASIFGGMPATGAIARTNVNVRSHGTSRIASMVHALTLLIIILFMAPLFSQIPSAAIAGVLIGTSFRIFNKATMLEIFSSGREKTLIFLVTAISTVSIDLIWGISIGIALYWAFALKAKFL